MSKRPTVDLSALTSDHATSMPEASQRAAPSVAPVAVKPNSRAGESANEFKELKDLGFKVPREFRQRFKLCAVKAGLKQNELLFEALEAWENQTKSLQKREFK